MLVDVADGKTLTLRGTQDQYVEEKSGDINLSSAYSRSGRVVLVAPGSILDALHNDSEDIVANGASLIAKGGSIGSALDALETDLTSRASGESGMAGTLFAWANDSIYLGETSGDLAIDAVTAKTGKVVLTSQLSILDAFDGGVAATALGSASTALLAHLGALASPPGQLAGLPGVDVAAAGNITLTARFGSIGEFGNDLDLDTASSAGSRLRTSSYLSTYLTEVNGNLYLDSVAAGDDEFVFIAVPSGAIVNAATVPGQGNVSGGKAYLFASGDIGSGLDPLVSSIARLEGQSTDGDAWVLNTGRLVVGGVTGAGLQAGGSITLRAMDAIVVGADLTADVVTLSSDQGGDPAKDSVQVASGVAITAVTGDVRVAAGYGFAVGDGASVVSVAGSIVASANVFDIAGRLQAAVAVDLTGTGGDDSVILRGAVEAQALLVDGGAGADSLSVSGLVTVQAFELDGGAGNDAVLLAGAVTARTFLIDGGAGQDSVNLFQTSSVSASAGITLALGAGDDAIGLSGRLIAPQIRIDGGDGRDQVIAAGSLDATGAAGNRIDFVLGAGDDKAVISGGLKAPAVLFDGGDGNDALNLFSVPVNADGMVALPPSPLSDLDAAAFAFGPLTIAASTLLEVRLGDGDDTLGASGAFAAPQVMIDGGKGRDSVMTYSNLSITAASRLDIILGADDDILLASGSFSAPVVMIDGQDGADQITTLNGLTLTAATTAEIRLGAGDDVLAAAGSFVTPRLVIDAGAGSDRLATQSGFKASGPAGNSIMLALGDGADSLTVSGSYTAATITVDAGKDDDQLTAQSQLRLQAATRLDLLLGDGADALTLSGTLGAPIVAIDGGAGNDRVVTQDAMKLSAGTSINLSLGAGDDRLTGAGSVSAPVVVLDAGTGDDSLSMIATLSVKAGTSFDLLLGDGADTLDASGSFVAPTLNFDGGAGNDMLTLRGAVLAGPVSLLGRAGDDSLNLVAQTTRAVADAFLVDGGEGSDAVTITRGGGMADYVVRVSDSGRTGTDSLAVEGSAADDVLLLRGNLVAGLQFEPSGLLSSKVERVQYDATLEGLTLRGMSGNDRLYSDDTIIATTLEGGAGNDSIQVGQLYGSAVAGVTDATWFAKVSGSTKVGATTTTQTVRGYLSNGNSAALSVRGGDGNDTTTVYANRAALDIQGQAGDDTTVVRALVQSGSSYVMHAPITVDADVPGAAGNDQIQLIGTELADDLLLVADRVQGMGVNLAYGGSDLLVVDGQERDDRFFVTASASTLSTRFAGGLGADMVSVGGDVTGRIVSYASWNPATTQPLLSSANILASHTLDAVAGGVWFEGGAAPAQWAVQSGINPAQLFAGEAAVALKTPVVPATVESAQLDILRVYDDGNTTGRSGAKAGLLGSSGLSGLGLGGTVGVGSGVEVFEVLMGSGNDSLTVSATTAGTITVINGGGGADILTATGGGGASAPLILLGDSLQDGGRYTATATASTRNGAGLEFANPGNDRIDASGASGAVVIYGGAGNDTLIGSAYDDQIAGGSGNDSLSAGGGNDHVYGDSGFNLDLSKPLALATQPLSVVNASTATARSSDALAVGNDTISGGGGKDILIGDHGTITQLAAVNRLLTTRNVVGVASVVQATGGANTFSDAATDGENWILAGIGADTVTSSKARNFVIADAGSVVADATGRVLSIQSTGTAGGDDKVTLGAGAGVVIGGAGADQITSGSGVFQVIGDHGSLAYDASGVLTDANTVVATTGKADTISLGVGGTASVVVLGGEGGDSISTGNGAGVVVGDHGVGKWKAGVLQSLASTSNTTGGNDILLLGGGDKVVIGGAGADTIVNGVSAGGPVLAGNAIVIGDAGSVGFGTSGLLASVTSTSGDTAGGADTIRLASRSAVVIGGMGSDSISVSTAGLGLGPSIVHVSGDDGAFGYDSAGRLASAKTMLNANGAKDTIALTVDASSSVLALGGEGTGALQDVITTSANNRYIVNDSATTTWNSGKLTSSPVSGEAASGSQSASGPAAPDTGRISRLGSADFFLAGMVGWGMSRPGEKPRRREARAVVRP